MTRAELVAWLELNAHAYANQSGAIHGLSGRRDEIALKFQIAADMLARDGEKLKEKNQ